MLSHFLVEVERTPVEAEVGLPRSGRHGMKHVGGMVVPLRDHKLGDNLRSLGVIGTTAEEIYGRALRLVQTPGVPGETLGPTIELMDLEKNEVAALTRSWCRSSALKMIEKEVKPEDT